MPGILLQLRQHRHHAGELAEALRRSVEELGTATISVGVGHAVPRRDGEPQELIRVADEALYAAKKGGRNRVVVA